MYHKWQSHEVWFLRYGVRQTESFIIFVPFFALLPPNSPKNQNFEKLKKTPGDIIILHMCTIIDNHIMYGSWDTERDRQKFLLFWTIFCIFTPLTIRKIKTLKKWKKRRYYHFTQVYHKWQSYDVWFLRYRAWQTEFFVILDNFLPFYPPNNPKNQNFGKMKQTPGDIIILHKCTINDNHMMYGSWDVKCDGLNFLPFWTIFCLLTP